MNEFLYYLNVKQFLVTAVALALVVPASNAETFWLLVGSKVDGSTNDFLKVPTLTMQECETAGLRLIESEINGPIYLDMRYVCVKGK